MRALHVEQKEGERRLEDVGRDRGPQLQAERVLQTEPSVLRAVLRLHESAVAELGHGIEPRPGGGLHALQLQQQDEGRDPALLQRNGAAAIAAPIPNPPGDEGDVTVLLKPGHGSSVVAIEAIALAMDQGPEVRRQVADGIAVFAEKPGDRGRHARRKATSAGLATERELLELNTDERELLQGEGGAVLLLSDRRNSGDLQRLYDKPPSIQFQHKDSTHRTTQLPAKNPNNDPIVGTVEQRREGAAGPSERNFGPGHLKRTPRRVTGRTNSKSDHLRRTSGHRNPRILIRPLDT